MSDRSGRNGYAFCSGRKPPFYRKNPSDLPPNDMPFLRLLQSPTRMAGHPLAYWPIFRSLHGLNTLVFLFSEGPGSFVRLSLVRISQVSEVPSGHESGR